MTTKTCWRAPRGTTRMISRHAGEHPGAHLGPGSLFMASRLADADSSLCIPSKRVSSVHWH